MEPKRASHLFAGLFFSYLQYEVGYLANNESYSTVISTFTGVFIAVSNHLVFYNKQPMMASNVLLFSISP